MTPNEIKILFHLNKIRGQNNINHILSEMLEMAEYDVDQATASLLENGYVYVDSNQNQIKEGQKAWKIHRNGELKVNEIQEELNIEKNKQKNSDKSRTDNFIFKIKDSKLFAPIIILTIVIIAIIGFWEKIEPIASRLTEKGNESDKVKKEFQTLDFILENFNPDTLIKNKSFHSIVSRRDYEMHFIIPNNWDLDEPLDEPAGLRYKSYYLPKNASSIISAYANITCIDNLADSSSTLLGDIDSQNISYKILSGLEKNDPDEGFCSLESYVNSRMVKARESVKDFQFISNSPSLKMYIENPENNYQIESRRIKYKFQVNGQTHILMELITYIDKNGFVLQFGAPEKEYLEFEDEFIKLTKQHLLQENAIGNNANA